MHQLTYAIANYVMAAACAAAAEPGSSARDSANAQARTDLQRLDELIEKLFSESSDA